MSFSSEDSWHLDKRIPVALIFAILSGYAGGVWWVSTISNRVDNVERQVERNSNVTGDIIQIKEQLRNVDLTMQRVLDYLDRRAVIREKADKGESIPVE